MKNLPDAPGLWHREGKNYRLASAGWECFRADGSVEDSGCDWNALPTGNWQPLAPPVPLSEARERFLDWLHTHTFTTWENDHILADKAAELFGRVEQEPSWRDWAIKELSDEASALEEDDDAELRRKLSVVLSELAIAAQSDKIATVTAKLECYKRILIDQQDFCGAAAVKDCLQLLNGFEPKLLKEESDQIAELKATIARLEGEVADYQAELGRAVLQAPVVIEGKGQAVTEEGYYWCEFSPDSKKPIECRWMSPVGFHCCFTDGMRFIKRIEPTFPPRAPFTAPPKPEPKHLYRITKGDKMGQLFWGYPDQGGNGAQLIVEGELAYWNYQWCETTGQPVGCE